MMTKGNKAERKRIEKLGNLTPPNCDLGLTGKPTTPKGFRRPRLEPKAAIGRIHSAGTWPTQHACSSARDSAAAGQEGPEETSRRSPIASSVCEQAGRDDAVAGCLAPEALFSGAEFFGS